MQCYTCGKDKDSEDFIKKRGKGLSPRCSSCREQDNISTQAWKLRNPDKLKASRAKTSIASKGVTLEQYQKLMHEQSGTCAICKNPPSSRALAIDHCHTTGKVRGLLCLNCNTALGKFKDNPTLLLNALAYLEQDTHKAT